MAAAVRIARRQDAEHGAEVVVDVLAVLGPHLVAEEGPHGAGRVEADRADVVPRPIRGRIAGAQDLDRCVRDGGVIVLEREPQDHALGHRRACRRVHESVVGEVRVERERDEPAVQMRVDTRHLEVPESLGAVAAQAEVSDAAVLAGHQQLVARQEAEVGGQVEAALDLDRLEVERHTRRRSAGSAGRDQDEHCVPHGASRSITRRRRAMAAVSRRSTPTGGMSRTSGSSCSPDTAR